MSKETRLLFCTTGVILRRLQEADSHRSWWWEGRRRH